MTPLDGGQVLDSIVVGGGQAGLSTAYHLARLGVRFLLLDAGPGPGGAWQHRWDSLLMDGVHGVADLPGAPAPPADTRRANAVLPEWFGRYERDFALPVLRPVRVRRVDSDPSRPELLRVGAEGRTWWSRTLVNATGTWDRPFVPAYPGAATFAGRQLHASQYRGAHEFVGQRVLVVGGGASAVQLLGEIAPVADTVWMTRREPVWAEASREFDGLAAVQQVEDRVVAGLPPQSVVSVTGLRLRRQEQRAAELGAYRRLPMFARMEPDGVRMADDTFERVDTIVWATGFRPAIAHLAPLGLRSEVGGVALLPGEHGPQSAVVSAVDPRVMLVGYGPSASTIGGNRAGRAAARAVVRRLGQ